MWRKGILAAAALLLAAAGPDPRKSGYDFMSPALKAMQDNEDDSPIALVLADGAALWSKSCASCHGDAEKSMRGAAAHLPDLQNRINLCRAKESKPPLASESPDLLALSAYVARQSRGMPITVADDPETRGLIEKGRALFERRQGQLNLSCANCHDERDGLKLGGAVIPQGHPTGYPIYRLEWQGMGSLKRRLKGCLAGVRAKPYADDAPEMLEIELFLMWRARGMVMDAPAIRP